MRTAGRARARNRVAVASALLALTFVAGCHSGSSPAAQQAPTPTTVATPTCPAVTATPTPASSAAAAALKKLPPDLPMPPSITPVDATTTSDHVQIVRFTTPTTLRTAVLFIVGRYPKAGYVLGRGDAEATEADAPFVRGDIRGLTRVAALQECKTLWLVAVAATSNTPNGTSPLLSPHPTSATTSSLPFG